MTTEKTEDKFPETFTPSENFKFMVERKRRKKQALAMEPGELRDHILTGLDKPEMIKPLSGVEAQILALTD